jgi:hypothetical protein
MVLKDFYIAHAKSYADPNHQGGEEYTIHSWEEYLDIMRDDYPFLDINQDLTEAQWEEELS